MMKSSFFYIIATAILLSGCSWPIEPFEKERTAAYEVPLPQATSLKGEHRAKTYIERERERLRAHLKKT